MTSAISGKATSQVQNAQLDGKATLPSWKGVMLGYFGDLGIGTTTGQIFGCLRERNVGSLKTTFGYTSKETAAGGVPVSQPTSLCRR